MDGAVPSPPRNKPTVQAVEKLLSLTPQQIKKLLLPNLQCALRATLAGCSQTFYEVQCSFLFEWCGTDLVTRILASDSLVLVTVPTNVWQAALLPTHGQVLHGPYPINP